MFSFDVSLCPLPLMYDSCVIKIRGYSYFSHNPRQQVARKAYENSNINKQLAHSRRCDTPLQAVSTKDVPGLSGNIGEDANLVIHSPFN